MTSHEQLREETVIQSHAYTPVSSLLSFQSQVCWLVYRKESGPVPLQGIPHMLKHESAFPAPLSPFAVSLSPGLFAQAGLGKVCREQDGVGSCLCQKGDGDPFLRCDLSGGGFSDVTHCYPTSIWRYAVSSMCCSISNPRV